MAYVLGGPNNEADGFTFAIANFALEAMHESQGLVDYTRVVTPNQGDTYLVPNFGAITYQDYNPAGTVAPGNGFGALPLAQEQDPSLAQGSIQATPAVAATAFDVFYNWTTSFELAATIGEELGGSYAEKVDQRVAASFLTFPDTAQAGPPTNTGNATLTGADGFPVMVSLATMELAPQGTVVAGAFEANTVLQLVRNIKQNYTVAKLPGTPIIVLDSNGNDGVVGSSMIRALSELSGGAVTTAADVGGSAITSLGEELLATGTLSNLYGCRVIFSNFLQDADGGTNPQRFVNGLIQNCKVGAYFHETAIFTVIKEGLQVKTGEKPGGLQMWLTGLAYMGAGVADNRRGGAINIQQV
jgi:hypothetical protein